MRIIKTTLVAGLISILTMFSANAEKVKIGDPGWTGATAIANLLAAVVIDKMGGEAELVPGNNTAIYAAIDRGKGEIDVHPDIWPNIRMNINLTFSSINRCINCSIVSRNKFCFTTHFIYNYCC